MNFIMLKCAVVLLSGSVRKIWLDDGLRSNQSTHKTMGLKNCCVIYDALGMLLQWISHVRDMSVKKPTVFSVT